MRSYPRMYNEDQRDKSESILQKDYNCKGSAAKKKDSGREP
jgi:hypothetical protein